MSTLIQGLVEGALLEKLAGSLPPGFMENQVQVEEGYNPEKENDGSVVEEKTEKPTESEKSDSEKEKTDSDDKEDNKEEDKEASVKTAAVAKIAARAKKYADFKEEVIKCANERVGGLDEAEKEAVSGTVQAILIKIAADTDWDEYEYTEEDVHETVKTAGMYADQLLANFRKG